MYVPAHASSARYCLCSTNFPVLERVHDMDGCGLPPGYPVLIMKTCLYMHFHDISYYNNTIQNIFTSNSVS